MEYLGSNVFGFSLKFGSDWSDRSGFNCCGCEGAEANCNRINGRRGGGEETEESRESWYHIGRAGERGEERREEGGEKGRKERGKERREERREKRREKINEIPILLPFPSTNEYIQQTADGKKPFLDRIKRCDFSPIFEESKVQFV